MNTIRGVYIPVDTFLHFSARNYSAVWSSLNFPMALRSRVWPLKHNKSSSQLSGIFSVF